MSDPADRSYAVRVTLTAEKALNDHALFIARQEHDAEPARRWYDGADEAVATLDFLPRRCGLAEEDAHRPYEVRRLIYGCHLILFTVDDANDTVYIIGLRHGARLPRPGELHATLDDVRADVLSDDGD